MKTFQKVGLGLIALTFLKVDALQAQTTADTVSNDNDRQERIRLPRPDSIPLNYVQALKLKDGREINATLIGGYALPEVHGATLNEAVHVLLKDGELINAAEIDAASVKGYEQPIVISQAKETLVKGITIHSVKSAIGRARVKQMWAE